MQPDNHNLTCRVAALVSVGRHPESGRARRAEQDARAVEMGMALSCYGLEVLHAGDPAAEALRSYAGMGVPWLRVLAIGEQDDAVAALGDYLRGQDPDIILTGGRAESGESSGMLPFLLGEALGIPVVTGVADIVSLNDKEASVLQALPRGQRRALRVSLPFIASVDMAAPAPRQNALGPAARARIDIEDNVCREADEARQAWQEEPARPRPKRLKVVKAKTAADRFRAATAKSQSAGGRVLRDKPACEMAQAIFDLLLEEGVVR
ncbi:electron transfer flavoprotein subunit beta [Pluralibacter gergoviae]|uniref:Electron transfer flavoprotein subunit beta n=1 Tax=Pluralibacter gergoviae TaxID=61647 RepID=A0A0J5PWE7_PLUGE|nr:electron transfer flavoprotein subunit beta [Pluralibacter gergoviae]KMK14091.1 electron transfer flavoprotein subunit beta [Pluralibacter gergoviae]KMK24472.1 electron transfer flavoprotein subunit beta [Pluralibacter gergoviae]